MKVSSMITKESDLKCRGITMYEAEKRLDRKIHIQLTTACILTIVLFKLLTLYWN